MDQWIEGFSARPATVEDAECAAEAINAYVSKNKKGTLLGNVVLNRYLKNTGWALPRPCWAST